MPSPKGTGRKPSDRPTLPDVASRAGVSIGTVSHVLNHPHRVTPATRDKVLSAISELGFSRNAMASALASGSTRTVGLVVPTLRNSLFTDVAEGAQRAARDRGLNLQLASADSDLVQQNAQLEFLDAARVLGLLLAPMEDSGVSIERLRRHGRPVVVLNYASQPGDVCTVLVDNEQVGYLAARHLIDQGRRRLAYVAGRYDLQPVALRRDGIRRAVAAARADLGEEVELVEVTVDGLDAPDGAIAGRRLLAGGRRPPDGVIAVTDLLAMTVVNQLLSAGLAVPEDVAVIGCDHNSAAWGGAIPLSSVTMEGERMGEIAVRLLLDELEQGPQRHAHEVVVLEPRLVLRESTVGRSIASPPS